MTIKELAYSAQQHLQASTGGSFKRAYIYELLAASFGFNSYAALCSESVFTQRRQDTDLSALHRAAVRQRCVELGYELTIADATSSELLAFIAERRIDVVRIADLVTELRASKRLLAQWVGNDDLEWDEDGQQDDDLREVFGNGQIDPDGTDA